MQNPTTRPASRAACALLILSVACSDRDVRQGPEASSSAAPEVAEPTPENAAEPAPANPIRYVFGGYRCDLRTALVGRGTCEEPSELNLALERDHPGIATQACEGRGGTWAEGECPTEGRTGTCDSASGIRTHHYASERTAEEAASFCQNQSFGTWHAAE